MAPNIADLVEHAVDLVPERVAIVCGARQVTYAELEERANRLAHHLAEHGVGPGAHVGFQCRNSIEAIETILAAYKLRSVPVNINYRWVENELHYLYDNADLVALVHDRSFTDRVRAVLPRTPKLQHVIVIDDGEGPEVPEGHGVDYEEALAGSRPERDFDERSADDIYILYTGGTTGHPKGVMYRHEDVWRALGGGIDFYTGEPLADEWVQSRTGKDMPFVRMSLAPLIHGAAQWAALQALFTCATYVLMPRFDPHGVWRAIDEHKVNMMTLVGDAMARPLIEAYHEGDYAGSSLFSISSQAALFSPSVQRQFLDAFPNAVLTDAVGSSEGGFNGIQMITKDGVYTGGPRIKIGPDVIVIDDEGKPVAPGSEVIGKIGRAGPIPQGYYKDPEKTAALFVEVEGTRYVVPGDFARVEDDGTVTLLGRANTCVNTGGEKVFPEEVEGALKSHPDVFDALVIGVPDERFGQRVAAVIAPRPGAGLDPDVLDSHVRKQLAGYKVPRTLWFVDEVGRLPSGKPDYRWAQRHAAEHDPVPDGTGSAPVGGC